MMAAMSQPSVVLVLNCGSSSVKGALVDPESGQSYASAKATRVGSGEPRLEVGGAETPIPEDGHEPSIKAVLAALDERMGEAKLLGVGHRVVHGGERFVAPTRIDDEVATAIESLIPLAPLHNPANLTGIRTARLRYPKACHVAVFDTAFHATLPTRARHYAIDAEVAKRHGVRRYGFHGPSHGYVAARAAAALESELDQLRIITCHLGNGASVCAVEFGRSIETSMGMTPVEGLVMGTRSGDTDVGALLAIARAEAWDLDRLDHFVNRESGLTGLSGRGKDMRSIEAGSAEGDEACRLAIQVFCHRLRKYIGAYAAVMGGVDAIVFTGGIGENSATIRHRVGQRLDFLGARLDEDANRDVQLSREADTAIISTAHSRCSLIAVKTDEQVAIARATSKLVAERDKVLDPAPIPIAVSARHIHLTPEAVTALFGEGHELTPYKPLSQPGQFACEEKLTIVGPKNSIESVRVLGPTRGKNQVEISRTDEFKLGIDAPVRGSGKVAGSAPCKLIGPAGELQLEEGVICAWRHIHMRPEDAEAYGVSHGDIVEVAVDSPGRDLVFGDVLVRVSPKYALEMHIDTDEANAAELARSSEGMLVPTEGRAHLRRKKS
jgi:acetate kinase